jgi:phytoene dehydrogenase-like protein
MKEPHIIIIGAGIAGLSTGCYAQMNGYRTQIFEMHAKPGGLCTSWKRKGYTFDSCLHHLAGTSPSTKVHTVWQELGGLQGRQVLYHESFVQVEDGEGNAFTVYVDPDRLEQHMKALAPDDAKAIEVYTDAVRRFARLDFFALPMTKPWEMAGMLPHLPLMIKWGKVTLDQYARRFTDPFLRRAFSWIQYDIPDVPAVANLAFLAGCHQRRLGWPVGGALALSQAVADRYADLGGELHYGARVEKVLVEADRAVGVRLADGTEHRADVVISAADGRATTFDMLDGAYINDKIQGYYDVVPDSQVMTCYVFIGAARDMSHEPHMLTLLLEEPVEIMGQAVERLDLELFGVETGLAPQGKTAIKVPLEASYVYWKDLYADRSRYDEEKERVAEAVIDQLERRFPDLKTQIEVVDVATPVTIERFTGNYHGFQAWGVPGAGLLEIMTQGFCKTLPGLEDFYMVGQWAMASIGISTVAIAGRKLIAEICRRDGKRFVVEAQAEVRNVR